MKPKYKCLILDHDDTAVDSTAEIHYPAHLEVMKKLRPDTVPVTLNGWFEKNFFVGIMEFLTEELKFNKADMDTELEIWRKYTSSITPRFYPGFIELLSEYRKQGGIIAVVSHSEKDVIKKHYSIKSDGNLIPDIIFGWDYDKTKRKPSLWPVNEILRLYDLKPSEALIVDDLKPGVEMGINAGIPVAAAGWAHSIPEIIDYMKKNCVIYLQSVEDLKKYIFSDVI